jgi:hypothetical protein
MKPKFKVGDAVIYSGYGQISTGTILKTDFRKNAPYLTKLDPGKGSFRWGSCWYEEVFLEHVKNGLERVLDEI